MQFGSLSAFVAPCHLLHSCCLFQRGPWGVITLCTDEHDATTESPARTFDTSEKGKFRELRQCELPRILLPRNPVDKGLPLRSLRYEAAFSLSRECKSLSM